MIRLCMEGEGVSAARSWGFYLSGSGSLAERGSCGLWGKSALLGIFPFLYRLLPLTSMVTFIHSRLNKCWDVWAAHKLTMRVRNTKVLFIVFCSTHRIKKAHTFCTVHLKSLFSLLLTHKQGVATDTGCLPSMRSRLTLELNSEVISKSTVKIHRNKMTFWSFILRTFIVAHDISGLWGLFKRRRHDVHWAMVIW